ncbi:helix-turn-helix transcriptional regulator [Gulosibacter sp. ACHW.36C]|uniref:Helix-turn-helix transcriptional regulator n=1 Tax=Gulosibacter sediminis TaxID=1729695 RepID=A0ABY4N0H3_9MICO|nr:helix-turn-helix transcriptional regulator [Gulosibacter sediminis]UQN14993.1 helix-turn-helix transcriptional regulator [Gulosibacter sediminis]
MLSKHATTLYEYVSSQADATVQQASVSLALRMTETEKAWRELADRRLITPAYEGAETYIAVAPEVALVQLVDDDERRIQELRSAVADRRGELLPLGPLYRDARDSLLASSQVEVVESRDTVQQLILDFGRRVTSEVLIVQPGRGSTVELQEESDLKDAELLEAGISRRTLMHDRRRDHVPTRRSVERLGELGAEFRTVPALPVRLLVFDRNKAIVSRHREKNDPAALVIRDPDVAMVFARLFDTVWDYATPFEICPDEAESADAVKLSATQQAILEGLSIGMTDEALASRLQMSVRTCRRHISQLFEILGADSRFQAGVLAARRGWL